MAGRLFVFGLGKNPSSLSPETLSGIFDLVQFFKPFLSLIFTFFFEKIPNFQAYLDNFSSFSNILLILQEL